MLKKLTARKIVFWLKGIRLINMRTSQKNVLGGALTLASKDPLTGFYRTGFCSTDANDAGLHVIAALMTAEFLIYSHSQGNDLISPNKAYGFLGLKAGNIWCFCLRSVGKKQWL